MKKFRGLTVLLSLFMMAFHVSVATSQPSESASDIQSKYQSALQKIERLQSALEQAQNENQALKQQIETLQTSTASATTSAQSPSGAPTPEALLAALSRDIEAQPNDARAYVKRGVVYMNIKAYPKAIADFSAAVTHGMTDAVIYNQRGLAHFQLGRLQEAIDDFTHAIKRNPQLAEAYNNRGLANRTLGDYIQATQDLRQAARLGLEQASLHLQILRDEIRSAQHELQRAGLKPGPADGIPGSQTLAALRTYQQRQDLPVTGRLDNATKLRLGIQPPAGAHAPQAGSELLSYFVQRSAPAYPLLARQRGWEGKVTLQVEMRTDGTIGQVNVVESTGHAILDQTAQQTVKQWTHKLISNDHTSDAHWGTLHFTFSLDEEQHN